MPKIVALCGILMLAAVLGWAGSDGVGGGGAAEAASETVTIAWGPYEVPAAADGLPGSTDNTLAFNVEKPCVDCYITGIVPNLVYPGGTTVNFSTGGMLHHMVLLNGSGTDATCNGTFIGSLGERIFASGNERTVMTAPEGYGYYVEPGESWNLVIDIMNFEPFPQNMYLEFEFTYRPGTDAVEPVTPIWLDIDNCGDSEYFIAAGYSDTHWDWTSDRGGYIVGLGGHLHNWGISIAAENVEMGEHICTSVAGFADGSSFAPAPVTPGDEGHPGAANALDPGDPAYMGRIEDMTNCTPTSPVRVGDTIRLHSQYNSPADDGTVMGIMVMYMYETSLPADTDRDGWPDASPMPGHSSETHIGTDPLSPCIPNGWPPDPQPAPDGNGVVQINDITFGASAFGSTTTPRAEIASQNGVVQIDDITAFASRFGQSCIS